jgi:hypothetical protein
MERSGRRSFDAHYLWRREAAGPARLSQNLEPVLLDDSQQLERRAAWLLRPGFPLLDRAFAGVEADTG